MNSTAPYWQFQFRNSRSGWLVIVGTFAVRRELAQAACAESLREGWEFVRDVTPEQACNPA
ncbi:hypothetical protein [Paraburkholderia rhynchosiae]|uniref:hypothetical protein n=1 Tax=Paraburkholderia rhynchosiae TaxID=487049 RepID=UPI0011AF4532|nr:hypothetical protein [Paraburkholderia rhynchosiae]